MGPQLTRGNVPHFTMRPHPALTGTFILVLITGLLLALSFFSKDEGTGQYRQQGILILMVTAVLCLFLLILGTSKLWFPHLWKKNSTHDRHKQHTRHHPAVKDRQHRNRR